MQPERKRNWTKLRLTSLAAQTMKNYPIRQSAWTASRMLPQPHPPEASRSASCAERERKRGRKFVIGGGLGRFMALTYLARTRRDKKGIPTANGQIETWASHSTLNDQILLPEEDFFRFSINCNSKQHIFCVGCHGAMTHANALKNDHHKVIWNKAEIIVLLFRLSFQPFKGYLSARYRRKDWY